MSRIVQVDGVDTVESSSTAVIVGVLAIIAAVVIALVWWQPWAAPVVTPQSNSTTVIHDTQTQPALNSPPVIVNPPAVQGGDTKVNIHNEVPKTDSPPPAAAGNTP